jgi:hypothetical protein
MTLNPDFCFFHIEKCMGSSLRKILYNYFTNIYNKNEIFEPALYGNNKQNLIKNDDLLFFNNKNIKVLLCHCSYDKQNITDHFSKSCFSITCIRNPIERFLSHYDFFIKQEYNCNFYELTEQQIIYLLDNTYNSNLLSLRLGDLIIKNDVDFFQLIDKIKTINCILITEFINDDIIHLNKILNKYTNTEEKIDMIHLNKAKDNKEIKERNLCLIRKYFNYFYYDNKLYEYICNMNINDRIKI